jgi:RNA polymerase I specific transcription initiation factor/Fungal Zn(2)-Cys(6) binuclear cluster domain
MSLFGGDRYDAIQSRQELLLSTPPPYDENGADTNSPPDHVTMNYSSPDPTQATPPQSARQAPVENASDAISSSSDSDEERPNKYFGPASTFREWTEAERKLVASIDHERAADLSAHLYNTHALKYRNRNEAVARALPNWKAKQKWASSSQHDEYTAYQPLKSWTAWPLKPEVVPRAGAILPLKVGSDHGSSHKADKKAAKKSEDLEEMLFAEMLKAAKEQFYDSELLHRREHLASDGSGEVGSSQAGVDERNDSGGSSEGRQNTPSALPFEEPVLLADDEKAQVILKPTVRHLLSNMDRLLKTLHDARESYWPVSSEDRSSSQDSTDSESVDSEESDNLSKRSTHTASPPLKNKKGGRPQKYEYSSTMIPELPINNEDDELSDRDVAANHPKSPKRIGRPRKYGKPLPGESYYQMRKRLGTLLNPYVPKETFKTVEGETPHPEKTSLSSQVLAPSSAASKASLSKSPDRHKVPSRSAISSQVMAPSSMTLARSGHPKKSNEAEESDSESGSQYETSDSDLNHAVARPGSRLASSASPTPKRRSSSSAISSTHLDYLAKRSLKEQAERAHLPRSLRRQGDKARRKTRLGIRDWSDMLGAASMAGFDEDAIKRASERCEALFGEKMNFVTLSEESAVLMHQNLTTKAEYVPGTAPVFHESNQTRQKNQYLGDACTFCRMRKKRCDKARPTCGLCAQKKEKCVYPSDNGSSSGSGSGGRSGFGNTEHVMEGGMHRDGYLMPVKRYWGCRGTGRKQEKKTVKRKRASSVWKTACLDCSRQKRNCDGLRSGCTRCVREDKECIYPGYGKTRDDEQEEKDSTDTDDDDDDSDSNSEN